MLALGGLEDAVASTLLYALGLFALGGCVIQAIKALTTRPGARLDPRL